jgi:hypothetical protein
MQHLSYPNPWPVTACLHIAKLLEHRAFLRTCLGGGIYKKGPYYTECGEMFVGDKKFGVVSYVLVGGGGVYGYSLPEIFLYFSTPRTEM